MAQGSVNLSGILSDPFTASAFFASVLRKRLAELDKKSLAGEISSVSWNDGTLVVKVSSRIAAAEFSLVRGELETTLSNATKPLGFSRKIILTIR
jgi:hypothetical protein